MRLRERDRQTDRQREREGDGRMDGRTEEKTGGRRDKDNKSSITYIQLFHGTSVVLLLSNDESKTKRSNNPKDCPLVSRLQATKLLKYVYKLFTVVINECS